MKISCPHCNVKGVVKDLYAGRRVKCPQCDGSFQVPVPEPHQPPEVNPDAEIGAETAAATPETPLEELYLDADDVSAEPLSGSDAEEIPELAAETAYSAGKEGDAAADEDSFLEEIPGLADFDRRRGDEFADDEFTAAGIADGAGVGGSAAAAGAGAAAILAARRAAMEDRVFEDDDRKGREDHWTVGWALSRAWQKTRGVKLILFLQGLLLLPLGFGYWLVISRLFSAAGFSGELIAGVAQEDVDPAMLIEQLNFSPLIAGGLLLLFVVTGLLYSAITGGMLYTAISRASGRKPTFGMLGRGFKHAGRLFGAALLTGILINIGFLLFLLPGLYLMVAWSMTFPLIVDRRLGIWKAMETSRRAVTRHWFKVFALLFILMPLLVLVSLIPFGLGLFWTLPMTFVLAGVIYCAVFGE